MSRSPREPGDLSKLRIWTRLGASMLPALALALGTASGETRDLSSSLQSTSCRTETRETTVGRLLELMGVFERARAQATATVKRLRLDNPQVPAEFWKNFVDRMADRDALAALYVPIYTRHLSGEDVCAILEFYTTPVGAHFLQVTPKIQEEARGAATAWVEKVTMDLLQPTEASRDTKTAAPIAPEPATRLSAARIASVHELLRVSGTLAGAQQMMRNALGPVNTIKDV